MTDIGLSTARTLVDASGMSTLVRIARAVATNQLARFAPSAYVRMTGQTGRGAAAEEGASDIARYFRDCVAEYFAKLGVEHSEVEGFLAGKVLMEYGPGDLPGVAALMVSGGAEKVYCIDRFPLVTLSDKNSRVMHELIAATSGIARDRMQSCCPDTTSKVRAAFDRKRIDYLVKPSGLSQLDEVVDLVISRAVLEHVNDLEATFNDMVAAMRPGALAIHLVDLRSHGLHKSNPLDFLAWSPALWDWMYSQKGVPNRWRIDRYRALLHRLPVDILALEGTRRATQEQIDQVRPQLAPMFRGLNDEDLGCLGFWLVMRKRGG